MADAQPQEEFFLTNAARMLHWFPWLRLFRACNIAIGLRTMFLAAIGILLLVLGELAIASVLSEETYHPERWHSQIEGEFLTRRPVREFRTGTQLFLRYQTLGQLIPWNSSASTIGVRLIQIAWSLLVMAAIGGAISRTAANDVAGRGIGSPYATLGYSLRRIWPSLMGLVLVVGAGGFLCAAIYFGGLISLIPVVGEFLLAIGCFFAFAMATLIAFMGLGTVFGWPIMICTISVEDSDGFDAMGRAFSYLFHHVIYTVFLLTIAVIQGVIALILLTLFVDFAEAIVWTLIELGRAGQWTSESTFDHIVGQMWPQFVDWIPAVFGLSYFWVAWTQIYFLLRARDDGTPFHMIQGVDPPVDPLPLSGMPAAKRREEERASTEAGTAL